MPTKNRDRKNRDRSNRAQTGHDTNASACDPNTDANTGTNSSEVFQVRTKEYTGPFELLADLVAKRKLDITAFSLAEVTEEFLAYLVRVPDLSQASQFLVIAATLLDIKAARLLPGVEAESEEELELLEARDLLISRLLQYKTYKEVAILLGVALQNNENFVPRIVGSDPLLSAALPKITTPIDPERLAALAAGAIFSAPVEVMIAHLHDPVVPVATQVHYITERLRENKRLSFRELIIDSESTAQIVSRFLAVLDMFRFGAVDLEQTVALGELIVIAKDLDTEFYQDTHQDNLQSTAGSDGFKETDWM